MCVGEWAPWSAAFSQRFEFIYAAHLPVKILHGRHPVTLPPARMWRLFSARSHRKSDIFLPPTGWFAQHKLWEDNENNVAWQKSATRPGWRTRADWILWTFESVIADRAEERRRWVAAKRFVSEVRKHPKQLHLQEGWGLFGGPFFISHKVHGLRFSRSLSSVLLLIGGITGTFCE